MDAFCKRLRNRDRIERRNCCVFLQHVQRIKRLKPLTQHLEGTHRQVAGREKNVSRQSRVSENTSSYSTCCCWQPTVNFLQVSETALHGHRHFCPKSFPSAAVFKMVVDDSKISRPSHTTTCVKAHDLWPGQESFWKRPLPSGS